MKQLKNIIKIGLKFAITSFVCSLVASDGTGDTNLNFPSYGTNTTMPRSDNAFDDAVNYHNGEGSHVIGDGIGDDLDVSDVNRSSMSDLSEDSDVDNKRGDELIAAVFDNKIDTIKNLIKRGATPVNYQDETGSTALFYAAGTGNGKVVELLLQLGASPNLSDENRNSPLQVAVENNYYNEAELLIKHGSNILSVNEKGNTPLDYAQNKRMKALLHKALKERIATK